MDLSIRDLKRVTRQWADKKCALCGKYTCEGDTVSLIIPSIELKKQGGKLKQNLIVHTLELADLSKDKTEAEVVAILKSHKTPRVAKVLTTKQQLFLDAFREAADSFGLSVETGSIARGGVIKRRLHGTSLTLECNVLTESLNIRSTGKLNIFDELYKQELLAKIYNKMHLILGKDEVDTFTAKEVLDNALNKALDIMGK